MRALNLPRAFSYRPVKIFRIWLLLLLALLLPIRGAMAAAMLCPGGSAGLQSELRLADPHAGHAMDHGAAPVGDGAAHHGDHAAEAADKCNMCSAFCSLTPLASESPRLPEPEALPGIKFPDLCTPAPSFLSDGQERPPRTI